MKLISPVITSNNNSYLYPAFFPKDSRPFPKIQWPSPKLLWHTCRHSRSSSVPLHVNGPLHTCSLTLCDKNLWASVIFLKVAKELGSHCYPLIKSVASQGYFGFKITLQAKGKIAYGCSINEMHFLYVQNFRSCSQSLPGCMYCILQDQPEEENSMRIMSGNVFPECPFRTGQEVLEPPFFCFVSTQLAVAVLLGSGCRYLDRAVYLCVLWNQECIALNSKRLLLLLSAALLRMIDSYLQCRLLEFLEQADRQRQ